MLAVLDPVLVHIQPWLAYVDATLAPFAPWQIAFGAVLATLLALALRDFLFDEVPLFVRAKAAVFRTARLIPYVRNKIESEISGVASGLKKSLLKTNVPALAALPAKGRSMDSIIQDLEKMRTMSPLQQRVDEFKVSGAIYSGGPEWEKYTKFLTDVYGMFIWSNPLHANMFPDVRQLEAEIVAMTCSLFGGNSETCGNVTSGGTESILVAMKAYRDLAASRGVSKPNLVLPRTAHPAFLKACQYFKISARIVDEDEQTRTAIPSAMARRIDSNTIALIGSCINYPYGTVDPIKELGQLAASRGVGLHVDCCLGSFPVACMRKAGFDFPEFDFKVKGVTSISCDTHKFGFAPKGSSVIMFSNKNLRHFEYSSFSDWPGGVYATPTIAGSRPGSLVAATWAAMVYHGESGYVESTKKMVTVARQLADGIKKIKGVRLMFDPAVTVVAFTSDGFNVFALSDILCDERGWDLNVLQFPGAIHLCVTMVHTKPGFVEKFLADLTEASERLLANPGQKAKGSGAVYGTSQQVPDRSIIHEVCMTYLDVTTMLAKSGEDASKKEH